MLTLNLDSICRICLVNKEGLQSLSNVPFANKIIELLSEIQVSLREYLPKNVCQDCIKDLEKSHELKGKIDEANIILKKQIEDDSDNCHSSEDDDVLSKQQTNVTGTKSTNGRKRKNSVLHNMLEKSLNELLASAPSPMTKYRRDCKDTKCFLCGKNYSCKGQLTRHLKTHTGIKSYVCQLCNKAYMESGSLNKHVLLNHSGKSDLHKCHECGKGFGLKSTLERHLRTHTGERPYKCDVCQKFYPSKSYLNKHKKVKIHGIREKSYVCEICSKLFINKEGLKAHLQIHVSDSIFRCETCNKGFISKAALKSHINYIHIKEKKFICQMCGKGFVSKSELVSHMRRHTGEKRPVRHKCNMCDKTVATSSHLRVHMMSKHTNEQPHGCEYCLKRFVTKQMLKVHTRYHTGERPYKCSRCQKAFVTNEARKVHERVHTGERPFACSMCDACFAQSSTLKKHMKSH